jgi:hypothetical protein
VSDISGTYRSTDAQTVRRTELTVTPVPEEEAGRFGLSTVVAATRYAGAKVRDVFAPVIVLARGLRRCFGWFRAWWGRSNAERRKVVLLSVVLLVAVVLMLPHGTWVLLGLVMATAALAGRGPRGPVETPQQIAKLQAIYNGLVPYFMDPNDPDQLFQPGGDFRKPFDAWCFDENSQLVKLELHYSPYFRDGEPEARARVEQVVEHRTGMSHDYMYEWNEEANRLAVAVMPQARAKGRTAAPGGPDHADGRDSSDQFTRPDRPDRAGSADPTELPQAPMPRSSRARAL